MQKIYIYGPPGSGKSTLGRVLAEKLGLSWVDLDDRIEKKSGISINKFFSQYGEEAFRKIEKELLFEASIGEDMIIILGGGALLDQDSRTQAEKTGMILCLDASYETLVERLRKESASRPLLSGDYENRLRTLYGNRDIHYKSFEKRINVDGSNLFDEIWEAQKNRCLVARWQQ